MTTCINIHCDSRIIIQQKNFNYETSKITDSRCKNNRNIQNFRDESLTILKLVFKNLLDNFMNGKYSLYNQKFIASSTSALNTQC